MAEIDVILERLRASELAQSRTIIGASEAAIAGVERTLDLKLPPSYRKFLLHCGASAGTFLAGTDISLGDLEENGKVARRLIHKAGDKWILPNKAAVIAVHQGYQFLFINCEADLDHQPVLHSMEGETPMVVAPDFAAWLDRTIDDELGTG